ncbi:MAG TPA: bifunctional hydroxymethylpyrimidine kinase/phosphomethylpyrimidine kinase [Nevskiaceae bacterium]
MKQIPVALSIAGSDPVGGAGIQADLKTFSALGAYGATVITAVVAENTVGVQGVLQIPAAFVVEQWRSVVSDIRVDAIKIGMLANAEIIEAVGRCLDEQRCSCVVLDPVMVATSGDRLLDADAIDAMRRLIPKASLITPNLAEAAVLLDTSPARTVEDMEVQARALVASGAQRALLKGGHLEGHADSVDVLACEDHLERISAPFVHTKNTHGTGCTLSSAIAALRPQATSWPAAVAEAKRWLSGALAAADCLQVGHGHGPVHHFYAAGGRWGRPASER